MIALKDIELIIYDFDGVMTDNTAYMTQDGIESVQIHRGDGMAVGLLDELGIKQVIISTETNPVVSQRAKKLGIKAEQGIWDKHIAVQKTAQEFGVSLDKTAFVGNDINDEKAMRLVGLRICPADAEPEIKAIAHIITQAKGGKGVVRELYRLLNQ